ncbi:hypothetical protein NW785_25170, partial [Escherichia coli]
MKQIGVLHTDPPKWLDNDHPPFKKHMYGGFMHLRNGDILWLSSVTFPVTLSVVTGKSGFCIAPE